MSYAARQDMIDRYGTDDLVRLTDRDGALDAIDDTVLTTALEDASAEINGYLAKRYTLPLGEVPRILVSYCCTIAFYHLIGTQEIEGATKRYDAAVSFLRRIARGEVALGDETPGDSQPASPGAVFEEGPGRTFSRDALKGY